MPTKDELLVQIKGLKADLAVALAASTEEAPVEPVETTTMYWNEPVESMGNSPSAFGYALTLVPDTDVYSAEIPTDLVYPMLERPGSAFSLEAPDEV